MTWEKKTLPYPNFHYSATDGDSRQRGRCEVPNRSSTINRKVRKFVIHKRWGVIREERGKTF